MALSARSLAVVASLQPSLQPLAVRFAERAEEMGIPVELVQGARTPEEQDLLKTSGRGVTKAGALESFHNYALAFDAVPKAYLSLPDWNPTGDAWATLGQIGKGLGLNWGGDWSTPDLPHFDTASWVSIADLKAYWEQFKTIMPVTVAPTGAALAMLAGLYLLWRWIKKQYR